MSVTLRLMFPGGRYHATPWGRHVNEGVPEWPPSPWRLLRALVAIWKRTCPDLPDEVVRRLLEQLVEPPRFHLPPHRVAHTRHYMPWEKKGPQDRTLVFDTFVTVGRDDPLLVSWPEATLDADGQRCLDRLLVNMTVLGRAEAWVEASAAPPGDPSPDTWNCIPADDAHPNPLPVFCPDPATCFRSDHYPTLDPAKLAKGKIKPAEYLFDCPRWHLCLDTETIHSERWPTVPGARWVNYTRPEESSFMASRRAQLVRTRRASHTRIGCETEGARAAAIAKQAAKTDLPTVARFLLDGPVLPLMTDMVLVAEVMRRAVMGGFRRWCERHPGEADGFRRTGAPERFASPTLSGKKPSGERLPGPGHAHYWPTASPGDPRRIGGVTIFARDGFQPPEITALASLRTLQVGDLDRLRVQLVGLGSTEMLGQPLIGPSTVWESWTPFLGHSEIGLRGRDRYLRKCLRREWRRLAEQVLAFSGVELTAIEPLAESVLDQRGLPRPRLFRRSRSKHGGREAWRAAAMYRLTFSRPLTGPLCLGYGHHFGFGRFAPAPET